jgi:AraC-like DNA-binding protein
MNLGGFLSLAGRTTYPKQTTPEKKSQFELLHSINTFGSLKKAELEPISRTFKAKRFPQDFTIVEQDRIVSHLGLIVRGSARVVSRDHDGIEHPCGQLSVGEFIIDMSLFIGSTAVASVISAEPSLCLLQHRTDFLEMLEKLPPLKDHFYRLAMLNVWRNNRMIYGQESVCKSWPAESQRIPKNIRKSIALIDQFYADPLTLDYLARESGMSRYHLSRLFKRYTGCSFKEYLNHKRVEIAKNLMRNKDLNVSEACFRVGYNDVSYFSRIFKAIEGVPPSTFRKNVKS